MQIKEAIILAGGLGTRLKSVINDLPKPMAEIDNRPFLEYILKYLERYGIEHVVLSVGYNWKMIVDHFNTRYNSIEISYAVEDEPLGTGGGISLALKSIHGEHTFILNGDTFFNIDLNDFSTFYSFNKADLAIAIKFVEEFDRYGTIELDNGRIIGFKEKGFVRKGVINGGVYLISKDLLHKSHLPYKYSFERDFLEKKVTSLKMYAKQFDTYFIDIGIPIDYKKASKEMPLIFQ